jgi:hypothetical protein
MSRGGQSKKYKGAECLAEEGNRNNKKEHSIWQRWAIGAIKKRAEGTIGAEEGEEEGDSINKTSREWLLE